MPLPSLGRLHASLSGKVKAMGRNTINLSRLLRFIRAQHVRIIHTNTIFPMAGALAALITRHPHVWHLREGLDTPEYDLRFGVRASRALIGLSATRLICISNYVRETSVPASAQRKAVVVPNALEDIPPSSERSPSAAPTIATVGLLGAKKRTLTFIHASALIARTLPEARFQVVGRPTAGEESIIHKGKETVSHAGMEERFTWTGHVPDPEAIYNRIDLLIHPGVHEAFGRVLIEAMSRGIPVVGVRSGAIPEIIDHGVTGLVVPPDDEKAMAEAAVSILTNPETYRRMSAACRKAALDRFDPQAHTKAIGRIYSSVTA